MEDGVVLGDVDEQGSNEGITSTGGVDGVDLEARHAALEVLKALVHWWTMSVSQHYFPLLFIHPPKNNQSSYQKKKRKIIQQNKPW